MDFHSSIKLVARQKQPQLITRLRKAKVEQKWQKLIRALVGLQHSLRITPYLLHKVFLVDNLMLTNYLIHTVSEN